MSRFFRISASACLLLLGVIFGAEADERQVTLVVGASRSPSEGQFSLRPVEANAEVIFWDSVRFGNDTADLQAYLAHYPNGFFVDLARNRIARLRAGGPKEKPAKHTATADAGS